jgi:DNA mismatch repair protein MutL
MGFRGEALASIAAVAQVELQTRTADNEIGTKIIIEGSDLKKQENAGCMPGTSVTVKNLFYNVPARRNFLKSNPVELRHIVEEFQRVALANPELSMNLFQNDMAVFQLKPGKLSKRITGIFGKNYQQQLVPCHEETEDLKIHGYVGKPENAKKSRGEQYLFVNNRFIKSPYINHAISQGYEGLIAQDQFPFFVLFIDIDPQHIDVNVHPTKTEIKFDDERLVYSLVKTAVKKTLGSFNITPSLDFTFDTNFRAATTRADQGEGQSDRDYSNFRNVSPRETSNLKNWEALFEGAISTETTEAEFFKQQQEREESEAALTLGSAVNDMVGKEGAVSGMPENHVFQVHNSYIATQVKSGLMFIDQQAAHERILYEKYKQAFEKKTGGSQKSLFPEHLKLNPSDFSIVKELKEDLELLGFDLEEFGEDTFSINGIPTYLKDTSSGKEILNGIIDNFKKSYHEFKDDNRENLARAIAANAAIKSGKRLQSEEMASLIDQLFACKNPNYNPQGQLVYHILKLDTIDSFFNRRA